MSNESLKLEKQLCYRLYTASRLMTRLYQPILEALNLTYPQYVTMLLFWELEEIEYKKLGEILQMSTGTLTPIIQRLTKLGYVTKIKDPNDDRKVIVQITDLGKSVKAKAQTIPENLANALDMSLEEYHAYMDLLKTLSDKLNHAL